jgi:hypothetical protein
MIWTWNALYQQVLSQTGYVLPDAQISAASILTYLSTALAEYQTEVRKKHCTHVLTLFAKKLDGIYDFPHCVEDVLKATYDANQRPGQKLYKHVQIVTKEQWEGLVFNNDGLPNDPSFNNSTDKIFIAFEGAHAYVWPRSSVTGRITIEYVPTYVPYFADIKTEGQWAGYNMEPEPRMRIDGPPAEFSAALSGMIAYAKLQLVASRTTNIALHRSQVPMWEAEYQNGFKCLRTSIRMPKNQTNPIPKLGTVRF